jgi:hypothetical protein
MQLVHGLTHQSLNHLMKVRVMRAPVGHKAGSPLAFLPALNHLPRDPHESLEPEIAALDNSGTSDQTESIDRREYGATRSMDLRSTRDE